MRRVWIVSIASTPALALSDVQRAIDSITSAAGASSLREYVQDPSQTWSDYRAAERTCTASSLWTEKPIEAVMAFDTTDPTNDLAMGALHNIAHRDEYPTFPVASRTCSATDSLGKEWLFHRIGPFLMAPPAANASTSYRFLAAEDAFDLSARLPQHMASFVSIALDGNNQPAGYPPIHVHHSAIIIPLEGDESSLMNKLLLNHQDYACAGPRGMECYLISWPPGVSSLVDKQLIWQAIVNDVRPAGSPPAAFSVESAVSLTEPGTQLVSQIRLESAQPLQTFYLPFHTFPIPATLPSVYWAEYVLPASGRALMINKHTHEGLGYRASWLVDGTVADLNLEALPSRDDIWAHDCSFVRVPAIPMEQIKLTILDTMREHGLGFRCTTERTPNYDYRRGDVQGLWTCYGAGADRFVKGTKMTNIAFFEPDESDVHLASLGKGTTVSQLPLAVLQHDHTNIYIVSDEPGPFEVITGNAKVISHYSVGGATAGGSLQDVMTSLLHTAGPLTTASIIETCSRWLDTVMHPKSALAPMFGMGLGAGFAHG